MKTEKYMDYHWIESKLKASGYKITTPRKRIIPFLEKHKGIFSAQDILRELKVMDKVSVYRTLELFQSLDIIHPITNIDGVQYYEVHGNEHHHHIICTNCHRSACVDCELPAIKVPGFKNTHHTFILTGLCQRCA